MMKSHSWDEPGDSGRDFFDPIGMVPDFELEEEITDKRMQRRRLTELRRRTEERLDWKRTCGDLQYDDLDRFEDLETGPGFKRNYRFESFEDSRDCDEQ